jgi:squalene-associated FAD-dependent desaturase
MALARFSTSAQWMGWQLNTDCSVEELLQRFDQTDNAIRSIWRPLCLAALNTPAHRASAQVFLNVLKDSLAANRAASDMLIPRTDLTALLPQAAAAFIEDNNGKVYLGCNVSSLYKNDTQWRLEVQQSIRPSYEAFDGVVIATQPDIAKKLLTSVDLAELIPEFEYESITTCYLKYSSTVKLPRPFLTLNERPADAAWGQFVFDRGQTNQQAGLLAVVVSASQVAIEQGRSELALNCAKQLALELGQAELALPKSNLIITEKHATFSCTPGLKRPSNHLPIPGLVLAGDYTDSRYPATLESAVQSGLIAATVLSDLDRRLRE